MDIISFNSYICEENNIIIKSKTKILKYLVLYYGNIYIYIYQLHKIR